MNNKNFNQAIKTPPGGWSKAGPENMRAAMAEMIASKHCLRAARVYDWATNFDVPIEKRGAYFMNIDNNSAILEDILNDQYLQTKPLKR